jgi:hypothetical protein
MQESIKVKYGRNIFVMDAGFGSRRNLTMIKLDDNYTIDSDAYNWILRFEEVKQGTDKEGKAKEILSFREWHHANFKQAVLQYINETTKWCDSLVSILDKLNEVEVKLDNLNITK